ncbi:MAG: cation:proton antiporter, partial [Nitrospinae bacterium]|nr:cation:proton antiporter [Nitrospinota bacterium]
MSPVASETLRHFFLIAILLAVTTLAHHLGGGLSHEFRPEESALALGFLLLFAFLVGQIVRNLGAPMIVGFLLAGILAGPYGLGMVNTAAVEPLKLINLLALSLIAFAAGGAMKISRFRARARSLVGIAVGQVAMVFPLTFVSFMLVFWYTGLMGSEPAVIVSAALLFGVFCVTNSPAEAIAVLAETRAKGPVAETIIGVTVLIDVLVIFLFGMAGTVAHVLTGADVASGGGFVGKFLYEQGISFLVGAAAGLAVIGYLSRFQKNVPLFLLGVAMVIVALCQQLDISPMMMAIIAGLVVENASKEGERFME